MYTKRKKNQHTTLKKTSYHKRKHFENYKTEKKMTINTEL